MHFNMRTTVFNAYQCPNRQKMSELRKILSVPSTWFAYVKYAMELLLMLRLRMWMIVSKSLPISSFRSIGMLWQPLNASWNAAPYLRTMKFLKKSFSTRKCSDERHPRKRTGQFACSTHLTLLRPTAQSTVRMTRAEMQYVANRRLSWLVFAGGDQDESGDARNISFEFSTREMRAACGMCGKFKWNIVCASTLILVYPSLDFAVFGMNSFRRPYDCGRSKSRQKYDIRVWKWYRFIYLWHCGASLHDFTIKLERNVHLLSFWRRSDTDAPVCYFVILHLQAANNR